MRKLLDRFLEFINYEHSYYIDRDYFRITRVGRFGKLDI